MRYNPHMDAILEKKLRLLVRLFLAENAKINLSAFRTEESCWTGNVLDSMAGVEILSKFAIRNPKFRVLDLGTGGGFPLLPLALSLPAVHFTGLDATQKKIDAVRRIADAMDLKNVELISGRAETLGHDKRYREQFDVVTARAVAEINVLLEYCSPFAKVGGVAILWKSVDIDRELKESERAQKEFHCELRDRHIYELPGGLGKRQLLIFEKMGKLSGEYPRAIGIAKKKPL